MLGTNKDVVVVVSCSNIFRQEFSILSYVNIVNIAR